MNKTEKSIETKLDSLLTYFKGTQILYHPYVIGEYDIYRQRTKTFGEPITLIGRAIHNPTEEQLSVIGNNEKYDAAFLFSRKEMERKFPTFSEGEWLEVEGELEWFSRRYKIEKAKPTGQIAEKFLIVVMLGRTIEGQRG